MELKLENQAGDIRGKIFFFSYKNKRVNLLELKRGFSRGGHYHEFDSLHIIVSGKIEYHEENINTGKEKVIVVDSPRVIFTPLRNAHMITALEDSMFVEVFDHQYNATNYPKYRSIIESKMNTS
jgi:dTDP-4-dehydrorhamnose 3,5-epimerase-like enzyme